MKGPVTLVRHDPDSLKDTIEAGVEMAFDPVEGDDEVLENWRNQSVPSSEQDEDCEEVLPPSIPDGEAADLIFSDKPIVSFFPGLDLCSETASQTEVSENPLEETKVE